MARAVVAAALLAAALAAGGAGAATPKRGGTVVVAWPGVGEPGCIAGCPSMLFAQTREVDLVLARALTQAPRGLARGLVSRTSITSRNPLTVVLEIRPEARWSDGRPVTAADFVLSHQLFLRYSGAPPDAFARTQIRSMTAVGPKRLRIVLGPRAGQWRTQLGDAFPLPSHLLSDGRRPEFVWRDGIVDPRTGRPIASGPFLLQRWQPGRELVLVRNPRYWGPPAHLDRLVFRFGIRDLREAFRRGEVDVAASVGAANLAAIAAVRGVPGVRLIREPTSSYEHFDIRVGPGGHPALRNRLVRQALAYGIDRRAIVRELVRRGAPASRVADSTALLPGEPGYQPNWRRYAYRSALARRLLERAGCRRGGDGIYSCGGERLSLRFVTLAGVAHRERTLQLTQAQLRRVGIEVVPVYVANLAFLFRGEFDVALFAWDKNPGVSGNYPYRCGDRFNFTGYCDRLTTRDIEQLDRIALPRRHAAVANQADRKLARDVPVIPLYQTAALIAYRESVRGIRPNQFGALTWNAEDWWRAR